MDCKSNGMGFVYRGLGVLVLLSSAVACGAAPAFEQDEFESTGDLFESDSQSPAGPTQVLRLYVRHRTSISLSTRYPDGTWEPMPEHPPGLTGTVRHGIGIGKIGYFYSFDGRAGGVLLADDPDAGSLQHVSLPRAPEIGGPRWIVEAQPAEVGDSLQACGVSYHGRPLHTRANAEGVFEPWTDLGGQAGELGETSSLSCAGIGRELHACVIAGNELHHSIRFADGSWQPWGKVENEAGQLNEVFQVRCRSRGRTLHILAQSSEGAHYSRRHPNGSWDVWLKLSSVLGDPRAAALREFAFVNGELHFVGIAENGLWHTVRRPSGRFQPLVDQAPQIQYFPVRTSSALIAGVDL